MKEKTIFGVMAVLLVLLLAIGVASANNSAVDFVSVSSSENSNSFMDVSLFNEKEVLLYEGELEEIQLGNFMTGSVVESFMLEQVTGEGATIKNGVNMYYFDVGDTQNIALSGGLVLEMVLKSISLNENYEDIAVSSEKFDLKMGEEYYLNGKKFLLEKIAYGGSGVRISYYEHDVPTTKVFNKGQSISFETLKGQVSLVNMNNELASFVYEEDVFAKNSAYFLFKLKSRNDFTEKGTSSAEVFVPIGDCSWVNVGYEFSSALREQTKFVLREDGRKPTDCSSAASQSFAKFFLEKVWKDSARVTVSVAGANGGVITKELKINEQLKIGENHVLIFVSTNGVDEGTFVVKRIRNVLSAESDRVAGFDEYVCPVGCKEVADGCLCPKVRVSKSGQGYSIDVSGKTVNSKKLTFLPGSEKIVALSEEGVSEDISAYDLVDQGLVVDVASGDSVRSIKVYSDKDLLETRLLDDKISVKTRETISASKEGLTVEFSGKEKVVKVLPHTASERAKEVLSEKFEELELKEVGNKLVYSASEEKQYRVFGFIPAKAQVSAEIDAETGETSVSKPWFSGISVEANK